MSGANNLESRFVPNELDHVYNLAITALVEDLSKNTNLGRVIGLFGPWGSGKTEFIRAACKANEGLTRGPRDPVLCIEYMDAWKNQYSPNLVLNVFAHLAQPKVDEDRPWYKTFVNENMTQSASRTVTALFGVGANIVGKMLNAGTVKEIAKDYKDLQREISDRVEAFCREHHESRVAESKRETVLRSLTTQAFTARNLRVESDRLVVVLDNLDRCSPETFLDVIECLEKTKQSEDGHGLHGIHFLLPVDPAAARKAVKARYPSFDVEDQVAYIEKVFSPVYWMPRLDASTLSNILSRTPQADVLQRQLNALNVPSLNTGIVAEAANLLLSSNPRQAIHLIHSISQHLARLPQAYRGELSQLTPRLCICAFVLVDFFPAFALLLMERTQETGALVAHPDSKTISAIVARARADVMSLPEFATELERSPQLFSFIRDVRTSGQNEGQIRATFNKFVKVLHGITKLGALEQR